MMMYDVIILAGGEGKRTKLAYNKVFYEVNGKPLLSYIFSVFLKDKRVNRIILVANRKDIDYLSDLKQKGIIVTTGGQTRHESVENGLQFVNSAYVLIHDGARPNVSIKLVDRILNALKNHEAVVPLIPIYDTIKKVEHQKITGNIDRQNLYRVQTPQGFLSQTIKRLYQKKDKQTSFTCDISLYEAMSKRNAGIVIGDVLNFKVTDEEDLLVMERILND